MCMPTKVLKRLTTKVHTVWKCINTKSTKNTWIPLTMGGSFERGKWQKAKGPVGFNCYTSERGARTAGWTTSDKPVKVRIRKVHGYGTVGNSRVVFAWEIFVPKRKKNGL